MNRIFLIVIVSVLIVSTCGQNKNIGQDKIVTENISQTLSIESDRFSINNYDFILTNESNDCILSYRKRNFEKRIRLSISAPCKVVRDTNTNKVKFDNNKSPIIFQIAGDVSKDKNKCDYNNNYESSKSYQMIIFDKNGELKLGSVRSIESCVSEGLSNGEVYWETENEKGIQWRKIHNISDEEYLNSDEINIFNHMGYFFEIKNTNNQCILMYKKGKNEKELKLDLSPPCKVIRNENYGRIEGKDVIFRFQQAKSAVFIVAGGIKKDVCKFDTASNYQAVLIKNYIIKLGG